MGGQKLAYSSWYTDCVDGLGAWLLTHLGTRAATVPREAGTGARAFKRAEGMRRVSVLRLLLPLTDISMCGSGADTSQSFSVSELVLAFSGRGFVFDSFGSKRR